MTGLEQRIYNLVKEQFGKMKFSKKYSNQAILSSKCQDVIYNDWGLGHDNLWKLVDKYVKEFISDEMD
jgi:hypothetical protein